MKHDIKKLPKWAQAEIENRDEKIKHRDFRIEQLKTKISTMEEMNRLYDHDWFALPAVKESFKLYRLCTDNFVCVASLGKGDSMFIGRKKT